MTSGAEVVGGNTESSDMLSRSEYLADLAEDYGLPLEMVLTAADELGPSKDYDGLLDALRDLALARGKLSDE